MMRKYLRLLLPRDQYTPLPSSPIYPPKNSQSRRSFAFFLLSFIFFASLVFNAVHIFRKNHKNPLDNYQLLNHNPLLDPAFRPPPINSEQHAVVTSLYTDSFAGGVAALGHSLRKVNTTARLIVIYLPDRISPDALCIATSSGFQPHPVSRIPPPHDGKGVFSHFLDQFTKLSVWTLDTIGIKSLVYLDADTLVKSNFDELFALPYLFAAVPDVYGGQLGFTVGINAGVLFLHPSTTVFNDMVSKITTANYPLVDAEQSFLNHYFGAEMVRLPYHYNANLAIKKRVPLLWEGMLPEQRIVHFTLVKPFIGRGPKYDVVPFDDVDKFVLKVAEEDGGIYRPEMLWWGRMFADMRQTYNESLARCKKT